MNFKIKYENNIGEELNFDLINILDEYSKVYLINEIVKKKEEYVNNEIAHLIYFISQNENVIDILKENALISSIEIIEVESIRSFFKLMHSYYDNGQLVKSNNISVIDQNSREIYYSSEICGEEETNKYYYDSNGIITYTFWYYNKGTLSEVHTLNPKHIDYINEFKHSFTSEEFKKLPEVDWEKMQYYHNAQPIIPM